MMALSCRLIIDTVELACETYRIMLGVTNTGNGEQGTGNRERESGNECTAVIRIRIQNGGRNHGKGSGN